MRPAPILIVDDDPFDVMLLSNGISALELNAPLLICEDGADAVAKLRGVADPLRIPRLPLPRAIFVDLNLPRIDGFSLIRWIRQQPRLAASLVIVVSGSDNPADVTNAYACGADEFVHKPADPAVLRDLLLVTA